MAEQIQGQEVFLFFTEFTVLLMSSASLGSIRCNNSSVGLKDF